MLIKLVRNSRLENYKTLLCAETSSFGAPSEAVDVNHREYYKILSQKRFFLLLVRKLKISDMMHRIITAKGG